jgi:long-chain acyl-CoA synthetase
LLYERIQRSPDATAYIDYDNEHKQWRTSTWQQIGDRVARWRHALQHESCKPGDRVAILLKNCSDWVVADHAALSLGLVVVPLYTDDRPDNIAYILKDAAVKVLIASKATWSRVRKACLELETLKRCVVIDADPEQMYDDERVISLQNWLGDSVLHMDKYSGVSTRLATIVYTSGTTGRPKGVMLSHYNILSTAHAALTMFEVYPEDRFLSFLPLSHTFERTVGYYLQIMTGSSLTYARSVTQLADDLKTIKPTVLIAVPRIFERFHTRVQQSLEKKSVTARMLYRLTVAAGWQRFLFQQGRGNLLKYTLATVLWPMLNRLVASKIRDHLGGNLRLAVSGGAALPTGVARHLLGLGFTICEGYGLTETSPVLAANPIDNNIPGSVGIPLPSVQVKIGDDDELVVKSPGVMMGYWNNHAATQAMIDADGWLHTGDQARIVDDHIFITGRLKDIIVLSNGEKMPPGDMEMAISEDPLFDQVMVIGEGKSYLAALLVLNKDEWLPFANSLLVDPYKDESLKDKKVHKAVLNKITAALHDFPGYTKVRRVHLSLEPWTVDNGLMTPTLKVKRPRVMQAFEKEIEKLYE